MSKYYINEDTKKKIKQYTSKAKKGLKKAAPYIIGGATALAGVALFVFGGQEGGSVQDSIDVDTPDESDFIDESEGIEEISYKEVHRRDGIRNLPFGKFPSEKQLKIAEEQGVVLDPIHQTYYRETTYRYPIKKKNSNRE